MLWWDWTGKQRLGLGGAMLCVSTMPWLVLGWFTHDWKAVPGGSALLFIPLACGWCLFVGLRTGRIPARGGEESRTDTPTWFWVTAAIYGAMALLIPAGFAFVVLTA